jgi:hypothetical protein
MGDVRAKIHQFIHFMTPKTGIKDKGHPNDLSMQASKLVWTTRKTSPFRNSIVGLSGS